MYLSKSTRKRRQKSGIRQTVLIIIKYAENGASID